MRPVCPLIHITENDREFYKRYIESRIPGKIFDMHIHINLPEHIPAMTEERLHSDWAFECGLILPYSTAIEYAHMLLPGCKYGIAGFPWPVQEADLVANNAYLANLHKETKMTPFMGVSPEMSERYIRETIPDFLGFKPYPDRVSSVKGADISIFSFLPHWQLEILNEAKKAVVIHLPRKNRIADQDNIRELIEIKEKYPDVTVIVAHLGRSYNPCYLEEAIFQMGEAIKWFYFDVAAVINPQVYKVAFSSLPLSHIMFGTDAPIMLWHGKRVWSERGYTNYTSENYSWNKHSEGTEAEKKYTFILYEQLKSILDTVDELGLGEEVKDRFFHSNAEDLVHRLMPTKGGETL